MEYLIFIAGIVMGFALSFIVMNKKYKTLHYNFHTSYNNLAERHDQLQKNYLILEKTVNDSLNAVNPIIDKITNAQNKE